MITPVIQNSYIVRLLTWTDIRGFLKARKISGTSFQELLNQKETTLVELLKKEGFSPDEADSKDTIALKNDGNGIEAYVSPSTYTSRRLTISANKKSYGIDPDYLTGLTSRLRSAGFKVDEVEGARRINPNSPYDWGSIQGRSLLAGYRS